MANIYDKIHTMNEQIKSESFNIVGGYTTRQETEDQIRADDESVLTLDRVFGNNFAYNAGTYAMRKLGIEDDPTFDPMKHMPELANKIPSAYLGQFLNVDSEEEMYFLQVQIEKELDDAKVLSRMGYKGMAANMLGSVLDVDAALMLMSGGSYLAPKTAALAAKATKSRLLTSTTYGATAGLEAATITELGTAMTSPTKTLDDLPAVILGTTIFGGTLGAFTRMDKLANKATQDLINTRVKEQSVDSTFSYDTNIPMPKMDAESSLGAAKVQTPGAELDAPTKDMVDWATEYIRKTDVTQREVSMSDPNRSKYTKIVDGANAAIQATPFLKSDFDRWFNSGSRITKAIAHMMFEDASGGFRNAKSGALLKENYTTRITQSVLPNEPTIFKQYLRETGQTHSDTARFGFYNEVLREMDSRYFDGVSVSSNPSVKLMADQMDKAHKTALDIMRGRQGETSVRGAENLDWRTGWRPFRWVGGRIKQLGQLGIKEEQIISGLKAGYTKAHPQWSGKVVDKVARAVVRRSLALEEGLDTSLIRLLDEEGTDYMRSFLQDAGIDGGEVESLIDGLKGIKADATKQNILKHRNEIDPRTPIPGTKYTLSDLMENNIPRLTERYARQAAGSSAMARYGIQKDMRQSIKDAVKKELEVAGQPTDWVNDHIDGLFHAFGGGALAGGLNPWVRRSMMVSNLSLLNGLGLTQTAETGAIIAAFGIDIFRETAPDSIKSAIKGEAFSPAMQQLADAGNFIKGEHLLTRPENMLDEWKASPDVRMDAQDWLGKTGDMIDKGGIKAQRIQGYLSLFYKVRQFQHDLVGRGYMQYLGKLAMGDKTASQARLYDMGFTDAKQFQRILDNFKKNVEFKDGKVFDLHPEKWSEDDWEIFNLTHLRVSNQLVQRAMRGEDMLFMHKDVGALLTHLKSFPLLAIQKQLIRNARIADMESVGTFLYSLAFAGMVYTAKQVVSGNTDNITPEKVAKGAFGLSNMTSPIPMFVNPLGAMLGIDALQFSNYTRPGVVGPQVLPNIPAYDTLEKLVHIPESAVSVMFGNYDKSDITAMQAIPIIGNLYGFSAIFNGMKDDLDRKKAEERRRKKELKETKQKTEPKKKGEDKSEPQPSTASDTINQAMEMAQ